MSLKEKKRIQVQLDKDLTAEAESIFKELGLNPTSAITAFYKRVVAKGGMPFELELTERELADLAVLNAAKGTPVKTFSTKKEFQEWLDEAQ